METGRLRAFTEWIAGQAAGHRHWAVGKAIGALLEGAETGAMSGSRPGGQPGGMSGGPCGPSGGVPVSNGAVVTPAQDVAAQSAEVDVPTPVGAVDAPSALDAPPTPGPSAALDAPPTSGPSAALDAPPTSGPPAALDAPPTPGPSAAPDTPATLGAPFAVDAPSSLDGLAAVDPPPTVQCPGTASLTGPAARPHVTIPSLRAPSADTRTDVLVKIGPATYGRHPWSVQLIYGGQDVTPVDGDDRGARAEELALVLREPLAKALNQGDHGEHLAAIEVFLPRKLFDLPVDDWQLFPGPRAATAGQAVEDVGDVEDVEDDEDDDFVDERALPLGMRRTVVVRDIRRNGLPPSPEWRRRWKGVARGPLVHGTLHGRPADEGHPPGARAGGRFPYYGALSAMSDASVPVYCGPVGSGEGYAAMRDALRSGHAVVLWRRDLHDHDECGDFHRQAADLLGLAGHADGLHGPVRDLRIRLADPETARAHGLRGKIAVLVDPPPDRTPYGTESMRPPPLAAPGG